jgi:dephospho-CoA kinase
MLKVGITGGIGTGKTTVCRIFNTLGIPVFSADEESKEILRSDRSVMAAIKTHFGDDVYPNGELDRKKLAEKVFSNNENLKVLNAITHPAVFSQVSIMDSHSVQRAVCNQGSRFDLRGRSRRRPR